MNKLYIMAGSLMYDSIESNYSKAIPFNEAMLVGNNENPLFSDSFMEKRVAILKTTKNEYFTKLGMFYEEIDQACRYNEIHLMFGEEPFCLMNLISILAFLEKIPFTGTILYDVMDEKNNVIITSKNITLGRFEKLYTVLNSFNQEQKENYLLNNNVFKA